MGYDCEATHHHHRFPVGLRPISACFGFFFTTDPSGSFYPDQMYIVPDLCTGVEALSPYVSNLLKEVKGGVTRAFPTQDSTCSPLSLSVHE